MSINEELRATLQSPVSDWVAAFNAHDVTAIVALYTDDAELFDAGMKYPRRGRDEIERWFSRRFATVPTITYTPTARAFMEQDRAAVTWTTSGRSPRLLGQAWLSRPFRVDGISIFTLRDGLIYKQRGYYDHLSLLEQILPPLKWLLPAVRL
jgi:ketosteroid isomerase-like protein